jgi:hypothetical protein
MKNVLKIILAALIILCIVGAIRPFWSKYWLGKELDRVSIYGTKHTIAQTKQFLNERMNVKGYGFRANDFSIEKDGNNNVYLSITYDDAISVLGAVLWDLEFTVERESRDVEQFW